MKVPYPITATSFDKDENGNITCVHAKYEKPEGGGPGPKIKT